MERLANNTRHDGIGPGEIVAGRYRVNTALDRDHGLLLEANHIESHQRVVIKFLPPGHGVDKDMERFRREARMLAQMESEHAARIVDVGVQDDGSCYLVRQYLEGVDLEQQLRTSGPLALADAVLLILQAAEAITEAHTHGIILRELSPAHLFLTWRLDGSALLKVIDFGTAKASGVQAPRGDGVELTATAMFGLSPYASPELVRKAKNVDVRMDVWSLGAIFYEMLTGRPPFTGDTAMLMLQITREPHTPVTQLRPDLPVEIDQILDWALSKDLDGRFANVYAFAHALLPYANQEARTLIERVGRITQAARARRRGGAVVNRPVLPAPEPPEPAPAVVIHAAAPASERSAPPPTPPEPPAVSVAAPASTPPSEIAAQAVAQAVPTPPAPEPAPAPAPAPRKKWEPGPFTNLLAFVSGGIPVLLGAILLRALPASAAPSAASGAPHGSVEVASAVAAPEGAAEKPVAEATDKPAATAAEAEADDKEASSAKAHPAHASTAHATHAKSKTSGKAHSARVASASGDDDELLPVAPASNGGSPSSSSDSDGGGTLVAVSTGGSCSFSVNGASKGTSSSLKMNVPAGSWFDQAMTATSVADALAGGDRAAARRRQKAAR